MTLSGTVTTDGSSAASLSPAATVPGPASAVRHAPMPESADGTVAPLPEAGPRAGLAVRTESRRQRRRQRGGRPVGPARPALLPVGRGERPVSVRSEVVWHHEAEVWRLVTQVW